jgi:hypothetical protein
LQSGKPLNLMLMGPSTGDTCGKLRLRTAKNARKSVPAHSGGVCEGTRFPHTPTGDTH